MGPRKIIFNGTPGEVWRNDTARVQYQFVCALINTCGFCLQYHMAIGSIWGIPMHWGCRCEQKRISIGANAPNAFVDFREVLDNMSHSDQVAAIGSSNYRLLKMGVADWKDIVTPNRVRDFREVVANKRLNVKTLVGAGVNPKVAERAYATVNTPGHVLAEQHQMALAKHALDAGLHLNELTEQLGKKIAGRVSIAAGPDSYGAGPAWSGGPVAPPSWSGPGHAAELAALLATAAARIVLTPTKKPEPPPAPKPVVPPEPKEGFSEHAFGESQADVNYEHGARHKIKQVFGDAPTDAQIASLAGAPDDAKVTVNPSFGAEAFQLIVDHPAIERMTRTVRRTPQGDIIIHNDIFRMRENFQGKQHGNIALNAFARQAEQSQKLGVSHIETQAFRAKGDFVRDASGNTVIDPRTGKPKERWAGYYVWPRFGYNGPLPSGIRSELASSKTILPPDLKQATHVNQLMAHPRGRKWWQENGIAIDVEFDLKKGSYSMRTLDAYLHETMPKAK